MGSMSAVSNTTANGSARANDPDETSNASGTTSVQDRADTEPPARRPGRPRSARAHQAIVAATLELLAKTGYQAMSLEGVAARAGVSKATIYRRWPSKEELTIEALASLDPENQVIETGDLRGDLIAILRREMEPGTQPASIALLLRLMGEVMENPELFRVYRERVVAPQMDQLVAVVERAKARGELRSDVDPVLLLELLGGPILLHFIINGEIPPLDRFAQRIVDAMWRGVAPESAAPPADRQSQS